MDSNQVFGAAAYPAPTTRSVDPTYPYANHSPIPSPVHQQDLSQQMSNMTLAPVAPHGYQQPYAGAGSSPHSPVHPQWPLGQHPSHTPPPPHSPYQQTLAPGSSYPPAPANWQASQSPGAYQYPASPSYSHNAQEPYYPPSQQQWTPPGQYPQPGPAIQPVQTNPWQQASPGYEDEWNLTQRANQAHLDPPVVGDIHDALKALGKPEDLSRKKLFSMSSIRGAGTKDPDELKLISRLAPLDVYQLHRLKMDYHRAYNIALQEDIIKNIRSTTGSTTDFRETLLAIVRGPLAQDCESIRKALIPVGTDEDLLNDILICRSNADMKAIRRQYGSLDLFKHIRGDLSDRTRTMFLNIIKGRRDEEHTPFDDADIQEWADILSDKRRLPDDGEIFSTTLIERSNRQIVALEQYLIKNGRGSLRELINKYRKHHMKEALQLFVLRATNRAEADAETIQKSVKKLPVGTLDDLLRSSVARVHWDRVHLEAVKKEYPKGGAAKLFKDVEGDTSGAYRSLLRECLEPSAMLAPAVTPGYSFR